MNNNNSLKVIKPSILKKIFSFFGQLLKRNKVDVVESGNEIDNDDITSPVKTNKNSKSAFLNSVKIQKEEKNEIELLQNRFENHQLSLKQLSNKQVYELNLLYEKQIEEIKRNIILEKKRLEKLSV